MRFDDRVTGRLKDFAPKAKIIHIDIDPAEIGKNVRPDAAIEGDVKVALTAAEQDHRPDEGPHASGSTGSTTCAANHPSIVIRETDEVLPQYVIDSIYRETKGDCYVVTGVGQHQMWAAQYFWYDKPNSFVTSGGLGTMGFEVPAAMGVQVGGAERHRVVDLRRRRLPDDAAGAGHDRRVRLADQVRDHEQRHPGHGAAVAGAVLQRTTPSPRR